MKVLQWSMTIPRAKQAAFLKWFKEVAGPAFRGFGAKAHEIYRVEHRQIIGRQLLEIDRFIERVYFDDDFDIPVYFSRVREDPKARKLSRQYEEQFGAKDIELRVLSAV
jgi:hypothetical protein